MTKLRLFLHRQREGILFCVLFAGFTILAFAALYAAQATLIAPLNRHLAWMTEKCLRLFGAQASSRGPVVPLSGFSVEIKNNCNVAYEIGLYTAAVWAYPASIRDRVIGTLLGGGVLYVANFLRIVTLLVVGLLQPAWFESTHLYAWQALFLLAVAICWLAWVRRVRPVA